MTSYTSMIENGEVKDYKEFLLLCTRAFGVASELRDEPLSVKTPTSFKANTNYYQENIERYEKELIEFQSLTDEEVIKKIENDYHLALKNQKEYHQKAVESNSRYLPFLEGIKEWEPPTEQHIGLKKFAIDQIEGEIYSDDYIQRYIDRPIPKPDISEKGLAEYKKQIIAGIKWDLNREKENLQSAIQGAKEKTQWMEELLDSLE